mmetsp:Transcript_42976/g.130811  ORF Transcript_42976/g.130811 Transcript_42976/m.130811 type:complete len:229 (-) Transcript_42976:1687-2373(-)
MPDLAQPSEAEPQRRRRRAVALRYLPSLLDPLQHRILPLGPLCRPLPLHLLELLLRGFVLLAALLLLLLVLYLLLLFLLLFRFALRFLLFLGGDRLLLLLLFGALQLVLLLLPLTLLPLPLLIPLLLLLQADSLLLLLCLFDQLLLLPFFCFLFLNVLGIWVIHLDLLPAPLLEQKIRLVVTQRLERGVEAHGLLPKVRIVQVNVLPVPLASRRHEARLAEGSQPAAD